MLPNSRITTEEKNWSIASHLLSFLGYFVIAGHFIGPLVVLLMKKDESPFIAHHAKESLNFAISWLIYSFITGAVCFVLSFILIGFLLAWILGPTLFLWQLIAIIVGAVKASKGELYYYPLTFRFLK